MREDFYSEYYALEDEHWWFLGRRRIFLSLLERELAQGPSDGRKALDVGCGTGTMLKHLSRFAEVQGIDADPSAVAFCRQRGLDSVSTVESGDALPFPDQIFDLVTALDVIEHVVDDRGLLRELHRVTTPGGTLLVAVPAYRFLWGPQDEISDHKRRYVARELRERVAAAGFELRRLSYFNTLLFPAIAALRLGRRMRRPAPGPPKSDFGVTPPGLVNHVLARLFGAEAALLRRTDLPFGVSVLALARRPRA